MASRHSSIRLGQQSRPPIIAVSASPRPCTAMGVIGSCMLRSCWLASRCISGSLRNCSGHKCFCCRGRLQDAKDGLPSRFEHSLRAGSRTSLSCTAWPYSGSLRCNMRVRYAPHARMPVQLQGASNTEGGYTGPDHSRPSSWLGAWKRKKRRQMGESVLRTTHRELHCLARCPCPSVRRSNHLPLGNYPTSAQKGAHGWVQARRCAAMTVSVDRCFSAALTSAPRICHKAAVVCAAAKVRTTLHSGGAVGSFVRAAIMSAQTSAGRPRQTKVCCG